MHQLRPASSVRSTSSSGMCLEIGAMRSAGDLFKRAPTASSSFSTLAAPMVRINSSSSSALSNRPLGFQPNNSSSTSTIINREVSPCKLACQDHSSQLTSRLAVQTTAPSFSEDLRGSTPDASVKWKNNRDRRSSKWWSDLDNIRWKRDSDTTTEERKKW